MILIAGMLSPVLMIVFSVLAIRNIRQTYSRVKYSNQSNVHRIQKRDQHLMALLAAGIISYTITNVPLPVYHFYSAIQTIIDTNKSPERMATEKFLFFLMTAPIAGINYSLHFYIYAATSKKFRKELLHAFQRQCRSETTNQNVVTTT
jgi:hypothetical protein